MTIPYIDTNIIVRLLTNDNSTMRNQAQKLFEQVEQGQLTITAPLTVIADAVFVLSSPRLYNQPRADVAAQLITLLRLPNFKIKRRRTTIRALELYANTKFDFGDCIIASFMHADGATDLFSFDKDFDKLNGIRRLEP